MRILLIVSGIFGVAGIALGAFGAHALEARLAASGRTGVWDTAVLYHLIHTVAIYAFACRHEGTRPRSTLAAWAWTAGLVLFSGSLYWLSLGGPKALGPITPIGGLAFIAGWILVVRDALLAPKSAS